MPRFGKISKSRLVTAHIDLQTIFECVIAHVDLSIIEGHRPILKQFEYFKKGRKDLGKGLEVVDKNKVVTNIDGYKKKGKHNKLPSLAVDFCPWLPGFGLDWENEDRFERIAFLIKGIALGLGIKVKLGVDWDGDYYTKDQRLHDVPHVELVSKLINGEWVDYE